MNTHHPQEVIPNVWLKVVTGESRNFLEPRYCGDILERVLKLIISIVSPLNMVSWGQFSQKIPWHKLHSPLPFLCHRVEKIHPKKHFRLSVFIFIKFILHSIYLTKLQDFITTSYFFGPA
jgi:hypothetical protein